MEFAILGPLEVRGESGPVKLAGSKQKALLAILLLSRGRPVSSERLIHQLWGEAPPPTAAKSVQVRISELRKALGDGLLVRHANAYALELPPGALDVDRFENLAAEGRSALAAGHPDSAADTLRAALAIWRGAPLADFTYDSFAQSEIARLEEARLVTLEYRIEADLAIGRHRELVAELNALVREQPVRERFRGQLMLALYRSGRQQEALEVYRETRARLRDELALEPGPELRALEQQILNQDPALRGGYDARARRPGVRARRFTRAPALIVAGALLVMAAAAAVAFLQDRGRAGLGSVAPNSLAAIDPETDAIVAEVPVGVRPASIAVGRGAVWVANVGDRTLTKVDPRKRAVVATVALDDSTPTGVAVGAGAVWVAHGVTGSLSRVDPEFEQVTHTLRVVERGFDLGSVAVGDGSVWAVYGDSTLARIDPRGPGVADRGLAGAEPRGVVVAGDDVWVLSSGEGDTSLARYTSDTFAQGPVDAIAVGRRPASIAFGEGALWVAHAADDTVTRVSLDGAVRPIEVGDGPTAVAVGFGSIWVANTRGGTVSRIDPGSNEVVETVGIGSAPTGIATGAGLVWIATQAP